MRALVVLLVACSGCSMLLDGGDGEPCSGPECQVPDAGGISIVSVSTGQSTDDVARTLAFPHEVASEDEFIVVLAGLRSSNIEFDLVTIGDSPLSLEDGFTYGDVRVEVWVMAIPPGIGTFEVFLEAESERNLTASAISLRGVDPFDPIGATNQFSGSGSLMADVQRNAEQLLLAAIAQFLEPSLGSYQLEGLEPLFEIEHDVEPFRLVGGQQPQPGQAFGILATGEPDTAVLTVTLNPDRRPDSTPPTSLELR